MSTEFKFEKVVASSFELKDFLRKAEEMLLASKDNAVSFEIVLQDDCIFYLSYSDAWNDGVPKITEGFLDLTNDNSEWEFKHYNV